MVKFNDDTFDKLTNQRNDDFWWEIFWIEVNVHWFWTERPQIDLNASIVCCGIWLHAKMHFIRAPLLSRSKTLWLTSKDEEWRNKRLNRFTFALRRIACISVHRYAHMSWRVTRMQMCGCIRSVRINFHCDCPWRCAHPMNNIRKPNNNNKNVCINNRSSISSFALVFFPSSAFNWK